VAESAVDRLLRLAAAAPGRKPVQVRQYPRMSPAGRPEVVRQHVQGHVAGGPRREQAAALRPGNVIQLGTMYYSVLSSRPYARKPAASGPNTKGTTSGKNTGSKGKAVNTAGPKSTGSQGKGVNTGSGGSAATANQNPQTLLDAAAKAARVPFNAPEVALELRQAATGKSFGVLTARATPVLVVR
jgi:hypothetical protein